MASSEPARLALYNRLEEVLGSEHAETLMTSLPFQPAAELATKSDIDRLESRIDRLESRVDTLAAEIQTALREHQRNYVITTLGAMTALTAIFAVFVGIVS